VDAHINHRRESHQAGETIALEIGALQIKDARNPLI
jgi:hypothetical protein